MREFERGLTSLFPAGFEGLEASRKRRLEACLRNCMRAASAGDWVLGIFDSNQDLVDFDTSGARIDDRAALALLSLVPFPSSSGPVSLEVPAEHAESLPAALGISVGFGRKHCAVLVLLLRERPDETWSPAAEAIRTSIAEIAEQLADAYIDGPTPRTPPVLGGPDAFFLLSSAYEVELEWFRNNGPSGPFAALVQPERRRLPLFLEQAVRRLTASWNFSRVGTCAARMSQPLHGLALRVVPMVRNSVYVGTFLDLCDDDRSDDRLSEEAKLGFRISSRERDVLYALLDGRSIAEIAEALNLAESTVNDHVARMIAKTNARNRIQMAATLLGWPSIKPKLLKNGVHNGTRVKADDNQFEQEDGSRDPQRPRPSWRYHIGSGGPLHPTDWLP